MVGVIRGFVSELFKTGTPIVSLMLAIFFYKKLYAYVNRGITNEMGAIVVSFLAIFVASFLILKIIEAILKGVVEGEIMGSLDHILGLAFGFVEGVIVVSFILIILTCQPWFDTSKILSESYIFGILQNILQAPIEKVENFDIKSIGETSV